MYSTCSCETLYVLLVTPGILVITPVYNNILHVTRVYNTRYMSKYYMSLVTENMLLESKHGNDLKITFVRKWNEIAI